jgi:hypothetical protein
VARNTLVKWAGSVKPHRAPIALAGRLRNAGSKIAAASVEPALAHPARHGDAVRLEELV